MPRKPQKPYSLKKKRWIVQQVKRGQSPSVLSAVHSIPRRTIYNWVQAEKTGKPLENTTPGRKPSYINPAFEKLVTYSWHKLFCGSHKLWLHLRERGFGVSQRQIQKVYNKYGIRMSKRSRPSQVKFTKYEWPKPNQLWHTDWTICPFTNQYLIAFVDDHSRFVVHAEQFTNATAENTILALKNAMSRYGTPDAIITDNGSVFTPAKNKGSNNSQFTQFCEQQGMKHILSRVNHPQTNGKVERWFGTYKLEFDSRFNNLQEFMDFYNEERLHQGIGYKRPYERYFT